MKPFLKGYYFITGGKLSLAGDERDVASAVEAGASVVQYREKQLDAGPMLKEALKYRALCAGKCLFIVNDRLDVALSAGADGVHVGQTDLPCSAARKILGPKMIIGVTVHDLAQAEAAIKDGADYLAVSPIFSTATKPDAGPPVGLELLRRVRQMSSVPLVAIGGIHLGNAAEVEAHGADAVCAISAVVTARDVAAEVRKFTSL